ncbi:substrate-binding domain-containing protein [Jatrophihabitans telluris]|uniref:Substrate-binding domain-containing protein n=1 Tax=Jatrophihabitans telluris TaxID=2038343 RepID=A0ABY4QXZ0_9ACTN|nr:substrate-binding domain-containing protein [Jatrophihabitans telluris]UQX88405.1 substrate-binding domain-containing protein [Jatrophihabitans telluris]
MSRLNGSSPRTRRSLMAAVLVAAAAVSASAAGVIATGAPAGAAASHDLITGTGSSWAANAVNQWVADVKVAGLRVVYTAPGSAQGRKDFAAANTDFGITDIGYQGSDPKTGADDTSKRPYAYLPVVGGGTAFPYQVLVGGKRVTNLRLSGETLAKIFTNQITNWSDSQITADNNGRKLPSKQIIPVVHSEGAGSTAQFTRYLAKQFPSLWAPFNGASGLTEYFPRAGAQVAQSGSDGVMNFISSKSGDGTIGYDEYSYPLAAGFPVAKIKNQAGFYTLPTQYNDAVALTQAKINMDQNSPDYLLQNLDSVYVYGDPRTYPLSSYSYALIPTAASDGRMTTAKRQTLADFLFYSVCGGQSEMGPIGYSSLPLNLVSASFGQIQKLKSADPKVDIAKQSAKNCKNPTFDPRNPAKNRLAEIDPAPPACDKAGAGPCTDDTSNGSANSNPNSGSSGSGSSGSGSSGGGSSGGGTSAGGTSHGGTSSAGTGGGSGTGSAGTGGSSGGLKSTGKPSSAGASSAATTVDPVTGQIVDANSNSTGGADSNAIASPTDLVAVQRQGSAVPFAVLAVVFLLLAIVVPPLLTSRLRGQK